MKTRSKSEGSVQLCVIISPAYKAKFIKLCGDRSYGLTLQQMIDEQSTIVSENFLHTPTD